jgi:hypothetical protein
MTEVKVLVVVVVRAARSAGLELMILASLVVYGI